MKKKLLFLLCVFCSVTLQANDSLRYKIAQMLIVGFRGAQLTPDNHIYRDVKDLHIGGVILFDYDAIAKTYDRNIKSSMQLKKLCSDLQNLTTDKLFITIDQEGGKVNRLKRNRGFEPTVTAHYLGQLNNADTTRFYARACAKQLKTMGFNVNFSPCMDIDVNPNCPVIGKVNRSFSSHIDIVQKHACIWIEEHHKQQILTSPKHFPGHGSSQSDTHLGLADVTETWTDKELQPYRYLIDNEMCDMIMVSHVFNRRLDADYPATLSHKIITGIIRNRLKYAGLVVTDDLAMGAIVDYYSLETALEKAVNAGADMLILSNNGKTYDAQTAAKSIDIIEKLVNRKIIPQNRIDEAYNRIVRAKTQAWKIRCEE
jgi:beta-N-acetylhexosaminidase